jgi:hypothetical protein
MRQRARSSSTANEDDTALEGGIELPIKEAEKTENEENEVNVQLSIELDATTQSTRSDRTR